MPAFVPSLSIPLPTKAPARTNTAPQPTLPHAIPYTHATAVHPSAPEFPQPAALPPPVTTIAIWLRTDLRLDDHPALHAAVTSNARIAPLYILPAVATPSAPILAALRDLRASLRARGAELYIRRASYRKDGAGVARCIAEFCQEVGARVLHFHRGVAEEERMEERGVIGVVREMLGDAMRVQTFWSNALIEPDELPFELEKLPRDCDEYSRRVRHVSVRRPMDAPRRLRGVMGSGVVVACGEIPGAGGVAGGERAALRRLEEFCEGRVGLVCIGKEGGIENGFGRVGRFLEVGCVSARRVYWTVREKVGELSVRRFCAEFELVLRDFLRLVQLKDAREDGGRKRCRFDVSCVSSDQATTVGSLL